MKVHVVITIHVLVHLLIQFTSLLFIWASTNVAYDELNTHKNTSEIA